MDNINKVLLQSLNEELDSAVANRDLEKVKALLSAGADINFREDRNRDTLLHRTSSVEVARELLLRGARINATNQYSETPLHYAITNGKSLEFVRELLKHGADVDSTNRKGNTALNHAVKRGTSLEIIKVLLEYGANINVRNRERRPRENCNTPLDNAIGEPNCTKLLIRYTLLKHFIKDYRKIIDLEPYKGHKHYSMLSSYLDDSVREILQMKTDEVRKNLSLYDVITNKGMLCSNTLSMKLAGINFSDHYPIYRDIIEDKIKVYQDRSDLLNKLSKLQVYIQSDTLNQGVKGKEVVLDCHSTYFIAEYLSNEDLSNFVAVFDTYYYATPSKFLEPDTRVSELSTSTTSNCAKRARLSDRCALFEL